MRYRPLMDIRIQCVVIDADDCERLARFWSEVLGWRITYQSESEWAVEPPEGSPEADVAPDILLVKVPDRKVVKNRVHLDLVCDYLAAESARLVELGAVVATTYPDRIVLRDPEGNEFCLAVESGTTTPP